MTTPHPQLLAWLQKRWPEMVPKQWGQSLTMETFREGLCYFWPGNDLIPKSYCYDGDAHAHIELNCIGALPNGWCVYKYNGLWWVDSAGEGALDQAFSHKNLADALWAAAQFIEKEMG